MPSKKANNSIDGKGTANSAGTFQSAFLVTASRMSAISTPKLKSTPMFCFAKMNSEQKTASRAARASARLSCCLQSK